MSGLRNAALVCAGVMWAMSASAGQDSPDRETQIVRTRCTVCHAMDLIAQQRLARPGWDREVAKMIGWGAAVDPSQASDLAAYLASRFGATDRTALVSPSEERTSLATNLLNTRCTVCHAADLIGAQRLDADGWRREFAKMVGWGAVLSPDEQALVVEHLADGSR